jgi:plastocyanin
MSRTVRAAVLSSIAVLAACGGSTAPAGTVINNGPTLAAEVSADPSIAFTPNTVNLLVGGSVTIDFGPVAHNVFFDNQPAGAPADITGSNANVSKSLVFATVGTYVYNCHIHPGMHGTVIVTAPTA